MSLEAINLKDGAKISVLNDYIGSIIKNSKGYYEEEVLTNFIDYIPHHGVIYDIGANIGNHTLFFSKYVKPSKIVSFEPSKTLFNALSENVRINKLNNVQMINSAVGEKSEKGILKFNTTNSGASNMEINADGDVEIVKIDDLELESPDFIKMDVEGFELQALKGMEIVLSEEAPVIWVEIQPENFYDVDQYLSGLGYILIDRWLDNYIYIKQKTTESLKRVFEQIKNKPLQRYNNKISELNLSYRYVTEQIKVLQSKLKSMETDYLNEKNKNNELVSEINGLKQTIPFLKEQAERNNESEQTERDLLLTNFEMKMTELTTEKTFLLSLIEDLKQRVSKSEEFTQKYYRAYADVEILKAKNESIQNELIVQKDNEKIIVVLKNKVLELQSEFEKKLTELETELKNKEAEIKELMEKHDTVKVNLEQVSVGLKEQLLAETKVVTEQAKTITLLKERMRELESIALYKDSQISDLSRDFKGLEEILNSKNSEIETYHSEIQQNNNAIKQLKNEKEQLLTENSTLKNELNNKVTEISTLKNEVNNKVTENEMYQSELQQNNKTIKLLKSEKEQLLTEYSTLKNELNNKVTENEKYQLELQQNNKTIKSLESEKEQLISENIDLKVELEKEIIDKIRLIEKEELFALNIENQLAVEKQGEIEKVLLNNKINKLEKQLADINKKYNSLSNSKLGKITSKYWKLRKRMLRGN
ncbi:FkbM family methyltransferase [Neobacillus driksii]|uniref:FkbM family methyltransferase n=1 Tax=Neobacillus driksii TaxID=3035913 RepID=UPI0027D85821|nr:FkbM family methyltransferase [Neobacillus niacini]